METTYRLEFNENQQNFHLDNFTHEPNTNGWITITDHCTDYEFKIFKCYIDAVDKHIKLTDIVVIKHFGLLKLFMSGLIDNGLSITKESKSITPYPKWILEN